MSVNDVFGKASSDIVFEEFDGDLVVVNLATGRYFGFNLTAQLLWKGLMGGSSPQEIIKSVGDSEAVTEESINAFVDQLISFELVVGNSDCTSTPLEENTIAELHRVTSLPSVETYDDLADLIMADPIHETVEDAGWPHVQSVN